MCNIKYSGQIRPQLQMTGAQFYQRGNQGTEKLGNCPVTQLFPGQTKSLNEHRLSQSRSLFYQDTCLKGEMRSY